jgi:hypothetical protein
MGWTRVTGVAATVLLAIGGVVAAAQSSAAADARPAVSPAVWYDTGRHFSALSTCNQQGLLAVQLDEGASKWSCWFNDSNAEYELDLYVQ